MTQLPVVEHQLVYTDQLDDDYYRLLQQKLRIYNRRTALQMDPPDAAPLNIRLLDNRGEVIGGMAALTYWGWLVIKLMVLDEGVRGNGVGKQLMDLAHQEARRRGCTRAQTMTYDFQALSFYERNGYRIVGQLNDYPDGCHYYWLRKDFEDDHDFTDDAPTSADFGSFDRSDRL